MPYAFREESNKQIEDMLDNGIISPSTSPWASPIVLVRKKSGELRFCIDYRRLNQITRNDAHPLPRVDDTWLGWECKVFYHTRPQKRLLANSRSPWWPWKNCLCHAWRLCVGAECGYVSMPPHSAWRMAEFNRMPFGLATAPATFQRAMELALAGLTSLALHIVFVFAT